MNVVAVIVSLAVLTVAAVEDGMAGFEWWTGSWGQVAFVWMTVLPLLAAIVAMLPTPPRAQQ